MEFRHKLALQTLLYFLAVFSVFRLITYILYADYFSPLLYSEVIHGFINGIRFDLSIILTFAGLPIYLLNLPINKKVWYKTLSIFISVLAFIMILLLAGDTVYFDVMKRHLGNDLLLAVNDADFVWQVAIVDYWYYLLIFISSFLLFLYFRNKKINQYFKRSLSKDSVLSSGKSKSLSRPKKIMKEVAIQIILIILIILGIRGTFDAIPINIINAYEKSSDEYGSLVINGVFSVYHIVRSSDNISHNYYKLETAKQTALNLIVENDEYIEDENFPLQRRRIGNNPISEKYIKPNIVIFLLESWTPQYIDSYSDNKFNVTPNFDAITKSSLKFTNAYANGDRSIYGITSSLLGIPQIIGIPYLGKGLELYNKFRIAKILEDTGYRTIFMQTSKAGSYKVDAIAYDLGFKEFYAKNDFPPIYKYDTDEEPYFGWDYEGLMFLEKKISQKEGPFFAYFFTGTTHEPYVLPDKKFEKFSHERNGVNGYLNTLNYADWALGKFFDEARKKEWFNNTIFIFMADHVCKYIGSDLYEKFHIPLVLYAPEIIEPCENDALVSQSDIPATIFDILNIEKKYSGTGKSILREYDDRFVIASRGETMIYINKKGIIQHDRKSIINHKLNEEFTLDSAAQTKSIERELLSVDQFLHHLLKNNKFYK